jgi:hypothetical protein
VPLCHVLWSTGVYGVSYTSHLKKLSQ